MEDYETISLFDEHSEKDIIKEKNLMGMARKVAKAAKLSIKNPSLVGKGIKNLVLYGTRGVKEKTIEEMVQTNEEEIVYSIFFDACSCKGE